MKWFLKAFFLSPILLTACTSFFYVPRVANKKFYDPSQVHLTQEEVEIVDSEGTGIHGWWFQAKTKTPKGTVIFFHGNAENLSTHFLSLSWLPEAGYNYLIFDYPGYGVSEGVPTPAGNVIAARAMIKWVHDNKDQSPLIVYGQSLGGNIAYRTVLEMKNEIPFKALILDGTFLSYRSMARKKAAQIWFLWPLQPIAWLIMSDAHAPKDLAARAPIPLLVIHGQQDVVVPPECGEEVFAESAEPKTIWRIENGKHGDTFWSNDRIYRQKLTDYLANIK